MDDNKYTVFTSGNCPWCSKAIRLLTKFNLDMNVVSLKNNPEAIAELQNLNLRTVPQIFLGDDHVGGYEDLLRHLKKKGLIGEDKKK